MNLGIATTKAPGLEGHQDKFGEAGTLRLFRYFLREVKEKFQITNYKFQIQNIGLLISIWPISNQSYMYLHCAARGRQGRRLKLTIEEEI